MIELLNIEEGDFILEPNAGNGAILDKLKDKDINLISFEVNHTLCELLKLKRHTVKQSDFLKVNPTSSFDNVIMNPPFEKMQDIDHITHAFNFLKEGGRLVAIASAGIAFRSDNKTTQFRQLIEEHGYFEELPDGSFKESATGVNTVLIVLDK